MDLTIGVITPHAEAEAKYKALADQAGCRLVFQIGIHHQALDAALEMQNSLGVDAVITQGVSIEIIRGNLDIPFFPMHSGNYDIIQAFYQARKLGRKIAFAEMPSQSMHYDFNHVNDLLGFDIALYGFPNIAGIDDTVHKVIDHGHDVMVTTGGYACSVGRRLGFPSVLVTPEERVFLGTVQTIKGIFLTDHTEKERNRWLAAVLDNQEEGKVVLDNDGTIMVVNDKARRFLQLKQEDIVGKGIEALESPNPLFRKFMDSRTNVAILKEGSREYVAQRKVIFSNGNPIGVELSARLLQELQRLEMTARTKASERGFVAEARFSDIRGSGETMAAIKKRAMRYAASRANILLNGESGSGKEIFAQSIHNGSQCADGPFVAVNCTALADNLLESELFGYEDGAFTGAVKGGRPGLFELAHKGTLFMDEIGDIPQHIQVKLLRVLQERTVRRIGGDRNIPVDVRFIFATNRDLHAAVGAGTFRSDLFYRVNVLPLRLPPLRSHKEDIGEIARDLVKTLSSRLGCRVELGDDAIAMLERYDWPGNVRELGNFLERAIVLEQCDAVSMRPILDELMAEGETPDEPRAPVDENSITLPFGTMADMENAIIAELYKRFDGDKRKIERTLEISPTTLWRRLKESEQE